MSDTDWTVLVPLEVLEGETVPASVVELLSTLSVVALGYHVLPEQTPPGQARMQYEDRAQAILEDVASDFREAGSACETRLVFTHDEEQTLNRVADETGCGAILVPNPSSRVERVLVPVRGEVDVARVTAFVASMLGGRDIEVTLYHVADDESSEPAGRSMVEDAATRLRDRGVASGAIGTDVAVSGTPVRTIAAAAADHDVVVMGESEPSLRSFLFGETADQVAAESLGPVVVVRRAGDSDAGE
ncbi:universal stress protein [Halopelagius longus]|uniref:Universal stress protein n=1 Tax=Halopelagius longus TaxID=1236180 RepID=A0A1H1B5T3_9EURY|nr:universal stress protein [Halopelagius longus]RDI70635.1 universal stress protein [Halopelagius longus]SDQ46756.1 Universal stress protein family protein [Halopelagius longus]